MHSLGTCLKSLFYFWGWWFGLEKGGKSLIPGGCSTKKGRLDSESAGPLQGRFTKRFSLILLGWIKSIYLGAAAIDVWYVHPEVCGNDRTIAEHLFQRFKPPTSFTTCPATCISRMHSMVQPSPWCNKLLCFDSLLQEMMLYELLGNEIGKRGRNFSSCLLEVFRIFFPWTQGTSYKILL